MLVIDASALTKYILREENWHQIRKLISNGCYSVDLILKEVANAIWKHSIIMERMDKETAETLFKQLKKLIEGKVIEIEPQELYLDEAFKLALQHKITIYDALYLAQAKNKGELLTCDKQQSKTALNIGIRAYLIE